MSTLVWVLLLLVAVLWPARLAGPLDGVPLDVPLEAIIVGLALPVLLLLDRGFLRTRTARVLVASLAAWKLGTWLLLTQQGVCATFAVGTGQPGQQVIARSWDFRTLAPGQLPECSAVLTRDLDGRDAFPTWFLNLPAGLDRDLDSGTARALELPPQPVVTMHTVGYAQTAGGVERIDDRREVSRTWRFDVPAEARWPGGLAVTVAPPTRADRLARYLGFLSPLAVLLLLGAWLGSAFRALRLPLPMLAAAAALTVAGGVLGASGDTLARTTGLLGLIALPLVVPERLQGPRAVVLLVGLPLLAMLGTSSWDRIGHVTLYSAGDDWQTFQRYAARIYFEGFWLEGGERTFWQQPLYRWIAGGLHLVFGDSSVGEVYWDGFGLTALASLAYALVRRTAAHGWALSAAALTVGTLLLGPNWYIVGRGLSEISGAAWVAVAALGLLWARPGRVGPAVAAGLLATLAFYTRLNHLILIALLPVVALPPVPASAWVRPRRLLDRAGASAVAAYAAVVAAGVGLFAARTWYYTGHFSLLYGTTRQFNSTGLGLDTLGDAAVWRRVLDSVLMVVTVQDPPALDARSVLVVVGTLAALAALLRVPAARDIPLAPSLLCLGAVASAFIARGMAYPGRFSIHLIPVAVSVSLLLMARLAGRLGTSEA